jgi:hypothetical protein
MDYANAISSIESGGRYGLLGPRTSKGDRAYGRYQVMGKNIPEWSKSAMGQAMSPQDFLANPQAQDAVFQHRFGQYVDKYGPEGAARAWFAGEGGMNKMDRHDQLGTTVASYAQRFNKALGADGDTAAPSPMAQAQGADDVGPDGTYIPDTAQLRSGTVSPDFGPFGTPGQGDSPGWGDRISGAAASLMAIDNPKGAAVLAAMNRGKKDPNDKTTFGIIGQDQYGAPIHGFIDLKNRTVSPANGGPLGATAEDPNTPPVTGEDALKGASQQDVATVRALSEGRMLPPSAYALKAPYWQRIMHLTTAFDPSYDTANAPSRVATRKDFASGKAAGNITALNTTMGHLKSLADAGEELQNSNYPAWNMVANAASRATGDPRVDRFNVARNAVATEAAKVFRQTGMSEKEIQDWRESFNANASKDQLHGNIAQTMELLNSRIDALRDQYNNGMKTTKQIEGLQLLSPKAQDAYKYVMSKTSGGAPASSSNRPSLDSIFK